MMAGPVGMQLSTGLAPLEQKFRGHFSVGNESSWEQKGQGVNWPRFYWPIRSWERIGLGVKRL